MTQQASLARRLLALETRALLDRATRLRPFSLFVPMVGAAAPEPRAWRAIEAHLARRRRELCGHAGRFLAWLGGPGTAAPPHLIQARYSRVRLRFNAVLSDLDIFADALSQRAEVDTGVWLAGLECLARDALALPGVYEAPPLVCYLDRGVGAAIRRARTRLPTGAANPVAIIRVPRERMVGAGIAASLVHEVGHQASSLLSLERAIRPMLQSVRLGAGPLAPAWVLWERWLSEILADLWAVGRIGVGAVVGLIAVVSLPRAFVFRISVSDPHPPPWLRVRVACAMGDALHPHPMWQEFAALWATLYPLAGLDRTTSRLLSLLDGTIPALASLLVQQRPPALRGRSLGDALRAPSRRPERLDALHAAWRRAPSRIREASPTLAFAVIGQARARGALAPAAEGELLTKLITGWALRSARWGGSAPSWRARAVPRRFEPRPQLVVA